MVTLVITSGPMDGHRVDVLGELVIGRAHAGLSIDDDQLSRRHLVVRPIDGGLEIHDLGSSNGTKVDGRRIAGPTFVRHGAVLTAGTTTIAVEAPAEIKAAQTRLSPSVRPSAATSGSVEEIRPFGTYQAAPSRRRKTAATRLWVPQALTYTSVVATAAALMVYFATR